MLPDLNDFPEIREQITQALTRIIIVSACVLVAVFLLGMIVGATAFR